MRKLFLILFACLFVGGIANANEALVVRDTNGKYVGNWSVPDAESSTYFSGSFADSAVLIRINSEWFKLLVRNSGFVNTGIVEYFTTSDCSGTTYAAVVRTDELYHGAIFTGSYGGAANDAGVANGTLYYAPLASATYTSTNSWKSIAADGTVGSCNTQADGHYLAAVSTYTLSSLGFSTPFSLGRTGLED